MEQRNNAPRTSGIRRHPVSAFSLVLVLVLLALVSVVAAAGKPGGKAAPAQPERSISITNYPADTASKNLGNAPAGSAALQPATTRQLRAITLPIEPNVGQAGSSSQYVAHLLNGALLFSRSGLTLTLSAPSSRDDNLAPYEVGFPAAAISQAMSGGAPAPNPSGKPAPPPRHAIIGIEHVAANPASQIESGRPLTSKVNYLRGKDPSKWQKDVSTYGAITYTNVYSGINLVYSGDNSSLNAAYAIASGASPALIRWQIKGAEASLDPNGNLVLVSSLTTGDTLTATLQTPTARQLQPDGPEDIDAAYSIAPDGTISLTLGNYSQSYPLLIDAPLFFTDKARPSRTAQTTAAAQSPAAPVAAQPPRSMQRPNAAVPGTLPTPVVGGPIPQFLTILPLRDLFPLLPGGGHGGKGRENENHIIPLPTPVGAIIDPVIQRFFGSLANPNAPAAIPAPLHSFEGISSRDGVSPPDISGDVGPNHYIQIVNASFQIFRKDGASVYGPSNVNALWSSTRPGTNCTNNNDGDPIVQYDQLADRWIMTQLVAQRSTRTFAQCLAISATADPTGHWYVSEVPINSPILGDYPKLGVWPDAYYYTTVDFDFSTNPSGVFTGTSTVALERAEMVQGRPYRIMTERLTEADTPFTLLPADLDGMTPPPAGAPHMLVGLTGTNTVALYNFHVDWTNPAGSFFNGPTQMATEPFSASFSCPAPPPTPGTTHRCIAQPGTGIGLDTQAGRLMYRLAYRNLGTHESLVTNHTVNVGGNQAGVRWYEIRDPNGAPHIHQQGTYAPDGDSRWMGSIAMDRVGNMGLGYSVSSNSTFPSIRYTGRLATDPAGVMPQGEAEFKAGGGSQTSTSGRWGDYTTMVVDPSDDCTFWYSNEYFQTTSVDGWKSRIGTFKFPGCDLEYSTYFGGSGEETTGDPTYLYADPETSPDDYSFWFDYWGSHASYRAGGMTADGYGNVYLTGYTTSPDLPVSDNPMQADCNNCITWPDPWDPSYVNVHAQLTDIFVTKLHLNSDGSAELVYSTYLGGGFFDGASDIAVDAEQNIYITGGTASHDFPTTAGAYQSTCPSCGIRNFFDVAETPLDVVRTFAFDAFVTKIISDGTSLAYSTFLGSDGYFDLGQASACPRGDSLCGADDFGVGIAVDSAGNAYVVGQPAKGSSPYQDTPACCWDFPMVNAFRPDTTGLGHASFVAKLNATGSALVYSTYLPGAMAHDVAVNTAGQAYVVGAATGDEARDFPVVNAFQSDCGQNNVCAFITKLTAAGSDAVFSSFLGGNNRATIRESYPPSRDPRYGYYFLQDARAVTIDAEGDAYIAGHTNASDFLGTEGKYQPSCNGCGHWPNAYTTDAFVTKVYTSGQLLWSTYLGGNAQEAPLGIAVSAARNIYVTGMTWSSDFPLVAATQGGRAGEDDVFLSILDSQGEHLLQSTYLGGTSFDWPAGVALQGAEPVIAGFTFSGDFPVSSNALQPNNAGFVDAFITKLRFNPNLLPSTPPESCGSRSDYVATAGAASFEPGTQLVSGSQRSVGTVNIPLPFTVKLYGTGYNAVHASVNGNLQFASNYADHQPPGCLPTSLFNDSILAFWEELNMAPGITTTFTPGIYTSTVGTAPNRQFNIEWRACLASATGCDAQANFEVIFYENDDHFVIVYDHVDAPGTGATVGVQKSTGERHTEYICASPNAITDGLAVEFGQPDCPSPTPTPSNTSTRTYTRAPTRTRTLTRTPTTSLTPTITATPTNTPTGTWRTATPTHTETITETPTATPTCLAYSTLDLGIHDGGFGTRLLEVNIGTTVRWTNYGTIGHTTTADFLEWDSEVIAPGETFTYTFDTEGIYTYYCRINESMESSVIVWPYCNWTPSPTPTVTHTPSTLTATRTRTWTRTRTATRTPSFTVTGTPPTYTPTPTPTFTATPTATSTPTPLNYGFGPYPGAGSIVPGDYDTGNHCASCRTRVTLPFIYYFYGRTYNVVDLAADGFLEFVSRANGSAVPTSQASSCLPASGLANAILPLWDDNLRTDISGATTSGIYTSVTGTAPNRIFNIEWQACFDSNGTCGGEANFEVRLYEGEDRFDIVYGQVAGGGGATIGVQGDLGSSTYTQYACSSPNAVQPGLLLSAAQPFRFVLDDGGREQSLGNGSGNTQYPALWLNRFSPYLSNYPLTINSISVLWPTNGAGTVVGRTARLLVYSDPDGDGNPSNATLQGQQLVTINSLEQFESYPVNIPVCGPGDIYIGFEDYWAQGGFSPRLNPASHDTTNSRGRSWILSNSSGANPNIFNLSLNNVRSTIDALGFPGNWLVRAGFVSSSMTCPTLTPSGTPTITGTPTRTFTASGTPTVTRTPTNTPTSTPTPTPPDYVVTHYSGPLVPGANLVAGSQCDNCTAGIALPFVYDFYGAPFSSVAASSNGALQFTGANSDPANSCLPAPTFSNTIFAYWDDLDTRTGVSSTLGIFTSTTGVKPNRVFNIEWRSCLFSSGACGGYTNFQVRLYEDTGFPLGQRRFDLVYGAVPAAGSGATVGVQRGAGPQHTQFACNSGGLTPGLVLAFSQSPLPTSTATGTGTSTATHTPTATRTSTVTGTPTNTPTPNCGPGTNYTIQQSTGGFMAGTTDIGNHCDDCTTAITLPFTYSFYGAPYSTAQVSSNGVLQFSSAATAAANSCLPAPAFNNAIFAHWDDLITSGTGRGIFTSTTGTAPNRIFNIEWRACRSNGAGACVSGGSSSVTFEARLYEAERRFDLAYTTVGNSGAGATAGSQSGTGAGVTQFSCNTASLTANLLLTFREPVCPTQTRTPTVTVTSTPTIFNTPTNTPTVCPLLLSSFLNTNSPTFIRPEAFVQGASCTPVGTQGSVFYYSVHELQLNQPTMVLASLCSADSGFFSGPDSFLALYQAPGGERMPGFSPDRCEFGIAANDDYCGYVPRVQANLEAGYFYVVVTTYSSRQVTSSYRVVVFGPEPGPCGVVATPTPSFTPGGDPNTATRTSTRTGTPPTGTPTRTPTSTTTPVTSTPTPTATRCGIIFKGEIAANDPFFVRPPDTAEGQACVLDPCTAPSIRYEVHEFYLDSPSRVLASLCPTDGGNTLETGTRVALYQMPGGIRVEPFAPHGCDNVVAVNNSGCQLVGSGATANLAQGYFYVVVLGNGAYTLAVHGVVTCPATPTPTGTLPTSTRTATPTATVCAVTRNGTLNETDPTYTRSNVFNTFNCAPALGNHGPNVPYDSYEFYSASGGLITASLCPVGGGSANFDAFVQVYQAGGGERISPFVATACGNALASDDDTCGFSPSVTVNLASGYYYVVVTQYSAETAGGIYTLSIRGSAVCGANPTPTPCVGCPTSTRTVSPTPTYSRTATRTLTVTTTPTACVTGYTYATATGTIVPGINDIGNHCDDCVTLIQLPFPFQVFGSSFSSAYVSSNGNLQMGSSNPSGGAVCPQPSGYHSFYSAIMPYQSHLTTSGAGLGVFTSTSGVAPNRIFNIEWRAAIQDGTGRVANFEVRLYETTFQIDFIFGSVYNSLAAEVGLQQAPNAAGLVLYSCDTTSITPGLKITFNLAYCATATVTRTPTSTATRTLTPTGTPPTATPANPSCIQYRTGIINQSLDTFSAPRPFAQGDACGLSGQGHYFLLHEFYIESPSQVTIRGESCQLLQLTLYRVLDGMPLQGADYRPTGCQNAVASVTGLNLKVTLNQGYFYAVVSDLVGLSFQYTLSVSSSPTLREQGEITTSDPVFVRPDPFTQGGACRPANVEPQYQPMHYDVYEYYLGSESTIVASTCLLAGGNQDIVSAVAIYQAPGGGRITPFVPDSCSNAVAAAMSTFAYGSCPRALARLSAGYFYVVVAGERSYDNGGKYTLAVLGVASCGAATPTPTGTPPTHIPTYTPTSTGSGTPPTSTGTATGTPTNSRTRTATLTRTTTPTFCAAQELAYEGFESNTLGLFSSAVTATPTSIAAGWRPVTGTVYAGSYSVFAPSLSTLSEQRLTLRSPVYVPAGATRAVLSFLHRYDFESLGTNYYDGGVLEISSDANPNWVSAESYLVAGQYTGGLHRTNILDRGGMFATSAWTGSTNGGWLQSDVNLLPFAGQVVRFRFRLGTDPSVGYGGWYIDDLRVVVGTSCGSATPPPTLTPTITPTGTPTPPCRVTTSSGDVPKAVPDYAEGSTGVVTSTLTVSGVGTISDLDVVGMVISHTWLGDLQVSLTSPAGTSVLLINRVCNSGPNTDIGNVTLDDAATQPIGAVCPPAGGTFRPAQPLSAFTGQQASGTWMLTVRDMAEQDSGTLNAWGLRIASLIPCAPGTHTPTRTVTRTPLPTQTYTPTDTRTATPISTATNTPGAGGMVVGHLTWQGIPQPNSRNNGLTATLTLCVGGVPQAYVVTTDAGGTFTTTTGLNAGTHSWRIKGRKNLSNTGSISLSPGTTSAEFGLQRAADANNDNTISASDFNILKGTFGKSSGDPGYDQRGDFNYDNMVSATDFNLLKGNFGQGGAVFACP